MSTDRVAALTVVAAPRPFVRWLRRARRSPALVAGAFLLTFMVAISVLAPLVAPYDPETQNLGGGLAAPSASHWFGTDQLGRDILSRVIWAGRTDLRIAVLAAIVPFITGLVVGLVSGYAGGRVDWVIGRIVDTFVAFPFYVLIIAIVFAVGTGENGIFIAYALVGWISSARVIRAKTKALCREGWVGAAYRGGLSHPRVVARHLLPNVLPQAVVLLMTEILLIMVAVVTLGYLGLGVQPPTPDWGTMISDGQLFLATRWWIPSLPGLAVVTTGVGLSLLGDGLADVWRLR
jgi:peptide/nickel transport system permease protein